MNKKTIKKALLLTVCAILLVVASVMGTLAYLTSQDQVTNTFTAGKVKIELNESDVDNDLSFKENAYHLIPGVSYVKDPTVTVKANSEECYVRLVVTATFEQMPVLLANLDMDDANIFVGYDNTKWIRTDKVVDATNKTMTYYYEYFETVGKKSTDQTLDALFDEIAIPTQWDNEEMAEIHGLKIDVIAQAIQKETFTTAAEAWAAFN